MAEEKPTCMKCEADKYVSAVNLIGGYQAVLCMNCSNAWRGMINDEHFEHIQNQQSLETIMAAMLASKIVSDIGDKMREKLVVDKHFFQLAQQWMGIKAEAPSMEKTEKPRLGFGNAE